MNAVTEIPMARVVSSNISEIGYHEGRLQIQFANGSRYAYDNVPREIHADFMASESKGKYFATHIRPKYTGVKQ